MRKIKVGELVLDFTVYPRADVDQQHIGYMGEALDAGMDFPPIIIEKSTRRVADGFHRTKMYKSKCGDDYEVSVIEKTYANDGEFLLDAIRYNANHGRNLTPNDRTHCLIIAEKMGVPQDQLASALSMTVEKLGQMRVGRIGKMRVGLTQAPVALKQTIKHMAGKVLTKQQCEANDRLSGMNQVFYVNQVITLIESGLLDKEDEKLMSRLAVLRDALDEVVAAEAA